MFAFKWLCTSTDSRSAPCNHILWAPARTLQNTRFLRVSEVKKMGCKSARLQYMPALFLGCCFRKWNLNGPQMQEPARGDSFISPSLFFFFFFFLLRHNSAKQSCQNVCQENSVWEYREGSSAGSCMLFRVGQRRRAGSKTRLIAVLTEIHKRDRSYQA